MEFHHLGSHCNFPDCKQLDFLPFKCSACDGNFCLDHRTYEAHNCRNAENTDRRAIICPMCNMPIVPLPNQDPNLVLDDHINQGCIVKASQSFKCNMKGCKKVDVLPMVCKLCRRHHCVRHRFESDHNCPRKPQPAKKAPTPTPANLAKPSSPPNNAANHPTSTINSNNINRNNNNNHYNNNQNRNNQNAGHVPNNANVYPSNMQPPSRAPAIETTIGVRLTNGEQLRHTCTIGTTLRELQVFIDQNRTDGAGPYKMRTTYPARELSFSDLDKTLSQLSLVPSGMIILQPFEFEDRAAPASSPAPNGSTNADNTWWSAFSSFFTSFLPTSTQQ